ncbi:hypothetical protein HC762_00270 [bacterium]|nr:hypothetical protein [bacterium]
MRAGPSPGLDGDAGLDDKAGMNRNAPKSAVAIGAARRADVCCGIISITS